MNARRALSLPAAATIVIVATVLAFWPVVTFDFTTWDDYETIARNRRINVATAENLRQLWTKPHMDLYIPVTQTVWALTANAAHKPLPPVEQITDKTIFLDARVFHAVNLALHAAAAVVAFLLLRRLLLDRGAVPSPARSPSPPAPTDLAALLGALLFALHPLQVEPVAWVSGTKDVLFALLALIALWQYIEYANAKAAGEPLLPAERWRMLGIATLAFVAAMLSKPTAIVTPLLAVVLDRLIVGRPWRDVLRTVWPWFVLAVPCVIWTKLVQSAPHAAELAPRWFARPLIALDALAFYLGKLLWPATLVYDYGRTPQRAIEQHWIAWTWILPTLAAVAALWLARRRQLIPVASMLVFTIVLLPVLGLVPFDFQAYSTVADHYMYLAMLAPALLLAWLVTQWPGRGVHAVVITALLALGARTFAQTWQWRDSDALFHHALDHNPRSFASLGSLGTLALDRGQIDLAIELSRRAMDIRPTYATSFMTLAEATRVRGDKASAMAYYRRALQYEPDFGPALSNLAAMLAERGEFKEALPLAERAAAVQGDSVTAQLNLGRMYFQLDRVDDARRQFRKVLQIDPANVPARELLSALP